MYIWYISVILFAVVISKHFIDGILAKLSLTRVVYDLSNRVTSFQ